MRTMLCFAGLCSLLLMTGCFVFFPYKFRQVDQEFFFSSDYNPGYEGTFRIDGYYYLSARYTSARFMVFYPDGTFMYNDLSSVSHWDDKDGGDSIGLPISDMAKLTDVEERLIGIYKVDGDTLRVDVYWNDMGQWTLVKKIFHIEDSITLRLCKNINYSRKGVKSIQIKNDIYRFAPANAKYSIYDNELKTLRMLWANDSDRIEYINNLEEYKINIIRHLVK